MLLSWFVGKYQEFIITAAGCQVIGRCSLSRCDDSNVERLSAGLRNSNPHNIHTNSSNGGTP